MNSNTLIGRPDPLNKLRREELPPVAFGAAGRRSHAVLAELDELAAEDDPQWKPVVQPLPRRIRVPHRAVSHEPRRGLSRLILHRVQGWRYSSPASIPDIPVPVTEPILREAGSPVNRTLNATWNAWFLTWACVAPKMLKLAEIRRQQAMVSIDTWRNEALKGVDEVLGIHRKAIWDDLHGVFGCPPSSPKD